MLKNIDWKDILIRATKTFIQAAGSCIVANLSGINFLDSEGIDRTFIIGLLLSSGAAGLSAVWNVIICPIVAISNNKNNNEFDNQNG